MKASFKFPSSLTKCISIILSMVILWPSLSWSVQSLNSTSQFNNQVLHIPAKLGTLDRSRLVSGQPLVVHVQDLHCNYEVQQNIASLIDYFASKHQLKLVGEEGASQVVNVQKYKTFPDKKIRQEVSDYFMKQGQLTGPEHYAINGEQAIRLIGLEERSLYNESRQLVKSFLNYEQLGLIQDTRALLEALRNQVYSPALLKLDNQKINFREGRFELSDYTLWLLKQIKAADLPLHQYKAINSFTQSFRRFKPRSVAPEALYKELDQLDQQLRALLYTNQAQREFDAWRARLDIMDKCINISVTTEELHWVRNHRKQYSMQSLIAYLQQNFQSENVFFEPELLTVDQSMASVLEFYELADKRSDAFVNELLLTMNNHNQAIGLMVSGGFHSEGILEALGRANVSYLSIRPNLTKLDTVNPYFTLLQDRKQPLEKLLAKNQNIMALPSRLPNGVYKQDEVVSISHINNSTRRVFSTMFELLAEMAITFKLFRQSQSITQTIASIKQFLPTWLGNESPGVDLDLLASLNQGNVSQEALVVPSNQAVVGILSRTQVKLTEAIQSLNLKSGTINFVNSDNVAPALKSIAKHTAGISVMTLLLVTLLNLGQQGISIGGPSVIVLGVELFLGLLAIQYYFGINIFPNSLRAIADNLIMLSQQHQDRKKQRGGRRTKAVKKVDKLAVLKKEFIDNLTIEGKQLMVASLAIHRALAKELVSQGIKPTDTTGIQIAVDKIIRKKKLTKYWLETDYSVSNKPMINSRMIDEISFIKPEEIDLYKKRLAKALIGNGFENVEFVSDESKYDFKIPDTYFHQMMRSVELKLLQPRGIRKPLFSENDKRIIAGIYQVLKVFNEADQLPHILLPPDDAVLDKSARIILGKEAWEDQNIAQDALGALKKVTSTSDYILIKQVLDRLSLPWARAYQLLKESINQGEDNLVTRTVLLKQKIDKLPKNQRPKPAAGAWPWLEDIIVNRIKIFNVDEEGYRLNVAWWLENIISLSLGSLVPLVAFVWLDFIYQGQIPTVVFMTIGYILAQWLFFDLHYLSPKSGSKVSTQDIDIANQITVANLLLTPLLLLGLINPWIYLLAPVLSIVNHFSANNFNFTVFARIPMVKDNLLKERVFKLRLYRRYRLFYVFVPILRRSIRHLINQLGMPRVLHQGDLGGRLTEFKENLIREHFIRPDSTEFYVEDIDLTYFNNKLDITDPLNDPISSLLQKQILEQGVDLENLTQENVTRGLNDLVRDVDHHEMIIKMIHPMELIKLPFHIQRLIQLHRTKQELTSEQYQQIIYTLLDHHFQDGVNIWQGGQGVVEQIGDVFDNGPDSIATFYFLRRLQKQAEKQRGRVIRIIGNHEWNLLPYYNRLGILQKTIKKYTDQIGIDPDIVHFRFIQDVLREDLKNDLLNGKLVGAQVLNGKLLVHSRLSAPDYNDILRELGLSNKNLNYQEKLLKVRDFCNEAIILHAHLGKQEATPLQQRIANSLLFSDYQKEPTLPAPIKQIFGHLPENDLGTKLDFSTDPKKLYLGIDTGMDYLDKNPMKPEMLGTQTYAVELFGETRMIRKNKKKGFQEEIFKNQWTWMKKSIRWTINVLFGKRLVASYHGLIQLFTGHYSVEPGIDDISKVMAVTDVNTLLGVGDKPLTDNINSLEMIKNTLSEVSYLVVESHASKNEMIDKVVTPLLKYFSSSANMTPLENIVIIYANGNGAFRLNDSGQLIDLWNPVELNQEVRINIGQLLIQNCGQWLRSFGIRMNIEGLAYEFETKYKEWLETKGSDGTADAFTVKFNHRKTNSVVEFKIVDSEIVLDLHGASELFKNIPDIGMINLLEVAKNVLQDTTSTLPIESITTSNTSLKVKANFNPRLGLVKLLNEGYLELNQPLTILVQEDGENDNGHELISDDIVHPVMPIVIQKKNMRSRKAFMQLAQKMSRVMTAAGSGAIIYHQQFSQRLKRLILTMVGFWNFRASVSVRIQTWLLGIGITIGWSSASSAPIPVALDKTIDALQFNESIRSSSGLGDILGHFTLDQAALVIGLILASYLMYQFINVNNNKITRPIEEVVGKAYLSIFSSREALIKGAIGKVQYVATNANLIQFYFMMINGQFWKKEMNDQGTITTFYVPEWMLINTRDGKQHIGQDAGFLLNLLVRLAKLQYQAKLHKELSGLKLETLLDDGAYAWRIAFHRLSPMTHWLKGQSLRLFYQLQLMRYWNHQAIKPVIEQANLTRQGHRSLSFYQFKSILTTMVTRDDSEKPSPVEIQFIKQLANYSFVNEQRSSIQSFSYQGNTIRIYLPIGGSKDQIIFYLKQLGLEPKRQPLNLLRQFHSSA